MNIKRPIYVGIDLCNEYSQVSYYNFTDNEPASVGFSGTDKGYSIPTVISKTIGKEQWFAGDEAKNSAALEEAVLVDNLIKKAMDRNPVIVDDNSFMPGDFIRIFLDEILQAVKIAAGVTEIAKLCITVENFHISLLNILTDVTCKLGFSKEDVILTSHTESFVYYSLCQKPELYKNDVALFEYDESGLRYRLLNIATFRGQKLVMTMDEDFSDEVPYELVGNITSHEYLDAKLSAIAKKMFNKKTISTVYLVGKAFSENIKMDEFLKVICDKKKAFSGQNLYVKGACYQAYETSEGYKMKDFMLACNERITTGVELKIQDRGKAKILRLVRPGINWYGADCSFNLIIDEAEEIEIFLSPVDEAEKQVVKIPLSEFPTRPKKATMVTLNISFTSDQRCHLMVVDRGFGEFFASSGRIINEEILL